MSTARQYGTGGRGTPRQDPQFYSQVQDEGVALPQEIALNFVGGGVTAADDAANNRTNVTIPLGAGLNPPVNPGENNMVCWGMNGNLNYGPQIFTDGSYLGVGAAAAALAQGGTIRLANAGTIAWRNAAGTLDIAAVQVDATNAVVVGGANGNLVVLQHGAAPVVRVYNANTLAFDVAVGAPVITQVDDATVGVTAETLTVRAQNAIGGGASVGGSVTVYGGTGATAGYVNILTAGGGSNIATFGNSTVYMALGGGLGVVAASGLLRLPNNQQITARNNGNTADLMLIQSNASDQVLVGNNVYTVNVVLRVRNNGTVQFEENGAVIAALGDTYLELGSNNNPAGTGIIRLPNNETITARNAGNTTDINIAAVNNNNVVRIGGSAGINTWFWLTSTGANNGNLAIGLMPASWQSARGIIFLYDATAVPTANPASGGFMYSTGGAGTWRGSSGTITTFGPSEPHCERCGSDFAWQWENEKYGGKLAICAKCLVAALQRSGVAPEEYVMSMPAAA